MNTIFGRGAGAPGILLALTAAVGLGGCGSEDTTYKKNAAASVTVNTPADIAQESAENYDDNINGLITGKTLRRWLDNWPANRPAGITGKLVVLQVSQGPAGRQFIKGDNVHSFVYLENGWTENRSNGVILTNNMVINGNKVDALFARYGIDPKNDLIVCAQGTGSAGNAMNQGRCWYTLRYWGLDKKNVAILNGGNQWLGNAGNGLDGDYFTTTEASPRLNKAVGSVQDLLVDNTVLQATLEDVINVLPLQDENVLNDGVFLWDARSLPQFSAGERAGPNYNDYPSDPNALANSFQNGGSRQGHARGELHLHYQDLLEDDGANGLYRSKAELRAFINGEVDSRGRSFVDGKFNPVGRGKAYQPGDTFYHFCETSQRSMITAISTAVILGKPTRIYDGGMIEWNSLSRLQDKNSAWILPADSRWRTDQLSWFKPNPAQASIQPRTQDGIVPQVVDPYAKDSLKIIREDKAYLRARLPADSTTGGGSTGNGNGGSGGGVTLPGNPCGG